MTRNHTISALVFFLVIAPLLFILSGCESARTGGAEFGLHDGGLLACEGAPLPVPERLGTAGTVDGVDIFLRSGEGLYTGEQLLESAPLRGCPACLHTACSRHAEDADCNLSPARFNPIPCTPDTIGVRISGDTAIVSWTCGTQEARTDVRRICGCDDPVSVSADGIVICPNGDAWDLPGLMVP